MRIRTLLAAALLSTTATLAYAQAPQSQPQDRDPHLPDTAVQASSQTPTPPQAEAQTPIGQGGGMMGQAGMSGGMMGAGSMMTMMGAGMPMIGMMQLMGNSGGGMGGMATIDRVEGRIAFLKTELKITDAQNDAWNAFADVLRANARKLGELRASIVPQAGATQQTTLADRLEWQEKWLTARAGNTRAIRTAYTDLSAKLTDVQKTTADQILAPHMGMMTMMSGMSLGMGGVGMGMGQMDPSKMTTGMTPPEQMMPGNQMMQGKMAPK